MASSRSSWETAAMGISSILVSWSVVSSVKF
jgi:hypothetical protein